MKRDPIDTFVVPDPASLTFTIWPVKFRRDAAVDTFTESCAVVIDPELNVAVLIASPFATTTIRKVRVLFTTVTRTVLVSVSTMLSAVTTALLAVSYNVMTTLLVPRLCAKSA